MTIARGGVRLAITSAEQLASLVGSVDRVARRLGPRAWLLLRDEPDVRLDAHFVRARALEVVVRVAALGARVVVADRLDVALALSAHGVGVQLPELGVPVAEARALAGPNLPIGASRHDVVGAVQAALEGADWITIAPVFPTPSKPGHAGMGVAALAEVVRAVRATGTPAKVLALGGIDSACLADVLATGVDGVAAIRAAWTGSLDLD